MTDPTAPDHDPVAPDLEVAWADFLPDGVTVDGGADPGADTDEVVAPTEAQTAEGLVAVPPTTPAVDEEIDLTMLDAVEHDLGAVDAALAALDDGSYGTCAVCRTPLPADLLAADPVRRTCPQHA